MAKISPRRRASNSPASTDVLKRYRAKAAGGKIDPIGYAWVPFAYAAGQVLAQAVKRPRASITTNSPTTCTTNLLNRGRRFLLTAADGDWSKSRMVWTQVQNVTAGNDRSVPRRQSAADRVAAAIQDRHPDLSLCHSEEVSRTMRAGEMKLSLRHTHNFPFPHPSRACARPSASLSGRAGVAPSRSRDGDPGRGVRKKVPPSRLAPLAGLPLKGEAKR